MHLKQLPILQFVTQITRVFLSVALLGTLITLHKSNDQQTAHANTVPAFSRSQSILRSVVTAPMAQATDVYVSLKDKGILPAEKAPLPSDTWFIAPDNSKFHRLLFRSTLSPTGQITFSIPISRYFTSLITQVLDSSGYVISNSVLTSLIAHGLLTSTAELKLHVGDVDDTTSNLCKEVDYLFVNGKALRLSSGLSATLKGKTDSWNTLSFTVPITYLKLPRTPAATTMQEIWIEVDSKKCKKPSWELEVDWAALAISTTVRPIVLIHGFSDTPENTWGLVDGTDTNRFTSYLVTQGIPFLNADLKRNVDWIKNDGPRVAEAIKQASQTFGSSVDVFAHSKGGLISRWAINKDADAQKLVRHLVTFSTPHHGIGSTLPLPTMNLTSSTGITFAKSIPLENYVGLFVDNICNNANANSAFPGSQLKTCKETGVELRASTIRNTFNYTPSGSVYNANIWNTGTISYYSIVGGKALFPNIITGSLSAVVSVIAAAAQSGLYELPNFDLSATYPWVATSHGSGPFPESATWPASRQVNAYFKDFSHMGMVIDGIGGQSSRKTWACALGLIDERSFDPGHANCETYSPVAKNPGANKVFARYEAQTAAPVESLPQQTGLSSVSINAGETYTADVPVDGTFGAFTIFSSNPVSVSLRMPSGGAITPSSVPTNVAAAYAETPGQMLATSGWTYQYLVASPPAGTWRVVIYANTPVSVSVMGAVESAHRLVFVTDKDLYQPNDTVRITATLAYGSTPVVGATFSGTVLVYGSAGLPITFVDNGTSGDVAPNDGLYAGQFVVPSLSYYPNASSPYVSFQISATTGTVNRLVQDNIKVKPDSARLVGPTSTFTTDADGDGLFDTLGITVSVYVSHTGKFSLDGTLTDASGNLLTVRGYFPPSMLLEQGNREVAVQFDGKSIRTSGINGPYRLVNIVLSDDNSAGINIDSINSTYTTPAFAASQFEGPDISLQGISGQAVDLNNDGVFDNLNFALSLKWANPGLYAWGGLLVAADGSEIAYANGQATLLSSPITTLTVSFDGLDIGKAKKNGPFTLAHVSLRKVNSNADGLAADNAFTTMAYTYNQFIQLPASFVANLVIDGPPVGILLLQPSQAGQWMFSGVQGQRVNIGVDGHDGDDAYLNIFAPNGTTLISDTLTGWYHQADLDALPTSGTYIVEVTRIRDNAPSLYTATLSSPISNTLDLSSTKIVTVTRLGQDARLSFNGVKGQVVALRVNPPAGAKASIVVYAPPAPPTPTGTPTPTPTPNPGVTGINPVVDGASGNVNITTPGQKGYMTFYGVAGQAIGLGKQSSVPSNDPFFLTVVKPNGTSHFEMEASSGDFGLPMPVLPLTGIYGITINPSNNSIGSYTVTLSTPKMGGEILIDGPVAGVSLNRWGQTGILTFSGTAGQTVQLAITPNGPSYATDYSITQPNGQVLTSTKVGYGPLTLTPTLGFNGVYTVEVDSYFYNGTSHYFKLKAISPLSTVTPAPTPTSNVTPTTTPTPLSTNTPTPAPTNAVITPPPPAENIIKRVSLDSERIILLPPLPNDGTYIVRVDPEANGVGDSTGPYSIKLSSATLGNLSSFASSTVTINTPGQVAAYVQSINPASNSTLWIDASQAKPANIYIQQPDGVVTSRFYVDTKRPIILNENISPGTYDMVVVPVNGGMGTYTIDLQPTYAATLTLNAAPHSFSMFGTSARLTFSASQGQKLNLSVKTGFPTNIAAAVRVYAPSGELISDRYTISNRELNARDPDTTNIGLGPLPATGIYTIVMMQDADVVDGYDVSLTTPFSVSGNIDGPTVQVGPLQSGQLGEFYFNANQDQVISLKTIRGSGSSEVNVRVFTPNGEYLDQAVVYKAEAGVDQVTMRLGPMPTTGTYRVQVTPIYGVANSFYKLSLKDDVESVLTMNLGETRRVSVTVPGKVLVINIPSQLGKRFLVQTTDDGLITDFTVKRPDKQDPEAYPCPMSMPGNYQIVVSSKSGITSGVTIKLLEIATDITSTVAVDSNPIYITSTLLGQRAQIMFTGTQGDTLNFAISRWTKTYRPTSIYANVYRPDGSLLCGRDDCWLMKEPLATTGNYRLEIYPAGLEPLNDLKISISRLVVGGELQLGIRKLINLPLLGQAAEFTFTGSLGQLLNLEANKDTSNGTTFLAVFDPWNLPVEVAGGGGTLWQRSIPSLREAGTYRVLLQQPDGEYGAFTLTLRSSVASQVMFVDGPTAVVTITQIDNVPLLTFTSPQAPELTLNIAYSPSLNPSASVRGSWFGSNGISHEHFSIYANKYSSIPVVPIIANSTYTVRLEPVTNALGTYSVTVSSPVDIGTAIVGGVAKRIDTNRPGQGFRFNFQGMAGDALSIDISSTLYCKLRVFRPDGTLLFGRADILFPDTVVLPILTQSGKYTVAIDPDYFIQGIGSYEVRVMPAVTGMITLDGNTVVASVGPGQGGHFTFTAAASQDIQLAKSQSNALETSFGVRSASGFDRGNIIGMNNVFWSLYTPATDIYHLHVEPQYGGAAVYSFTLSTPISANLIVDGPPLLLDIPRFGQGANLFFVPRVGQDYSVGFSAVPTSSLVALDSSIKADVSFHYIAGSALPYDFAVNNQGLSRRIGPFPTEDSERLTLRQTSQSTGKFRVTLSTPLTQSMEIDAPATAITFTREGQGAKIRFTGALSQLITLTAQFSPVNGATWYKVVQPNGTTLTEFQFTDGGTKSRTLPRLPESGGYMLYLSRQDAVTGTVILKLATQASSNATPTPTPTPASPTTLIDELNDYTKLYERSNTGSLYLQTGGENLTDGDTSRIARYGTGAEWVTWQLTNVRSITATVYFWPNEAVNHFSFAYSANNVSFTPVTPRIVDAGGNWQKFIYTLTLPVGANYVRIIFPATSTVNYWTPQLGQVVLSTVATTSVATATPTNTATPSPASTPTKTSTPTSTATPISTYTSTPTSTPIPSNGMLTDDLNDFTKLIERSNTSWFYVQSDDGTQTAGDVSRLARYVNTPEWATWQLTNVRSVTATAYFWPDEPINHFSFSYSSNNISFTPIAPTIMDSGGAWHKFVYMLNLPVGANYVRIIFPSSTNYWTPQLGQVVLSTAASAPTATNTPTPTPTSTQTPTSTATKTSTPTPTQTPAPSPLTTLVVNGPALPVTITTPGQTAVLAFTGTASQLLNMAINSTGAANATVKVYRPDGVLFDSLGVVGQSNLDLAALPASGTYTLSLVPISSGTGIYTFTLSTPVTGVLAVDGATLTRTVTRAGQDVRLTFTGAQSQVLNLAVNSTGAGNANVVVYKPDGALFDNGSAVGQGNSDLAALPITGIYTILVNPVGNSTGTYTFTLSSPVTGTLVVNGAVLTRAVARAGQDVRLAFTGTQSQVLNLAVDSTGAGNANVAVYKPDGTLFDSGSAVGQGNSDLVALPTPGTYAIVVNPVSNSTGTYTFTLSTPVTANLAVNGAAVSITLARAGQDARLSFAGLLSQPLTLTVNTPSGKPAALVIYKPDGSTLRTGSASGTSVLGLGNMPVAGNYTVLLNPASNYTGTYTLTLSLPLTDSTNLAPSGTAYRWSAMTTSIADVTKTAAPGLNDNLTNIDVDLNTANEVTNTFEGAGVTWATSQTIGTVKFIAGSWDGNGAFASGLVLQTTPNGTTWVTSTWTVSPTYSYTNTTAGVTYKFTGAPVLVRGVRVVGKLNITGNTSKRARVREVMAYTAQNAFLLNPVIRSAFRPNARKSERVAQSRAGFFISLR